MEKREENDHLEKLISVAMDSMAVAVSIIDPKGTLLYYNRHATEILDRRPEYVGTDVHSHHKKAASNQKLDQMLREFAEGRREPFCFEAKPYGKVIIVTLSPMLKDGEFVGCVQSVRLKEDTPGEQ